MAHGVRGVNRHNICPICGHADWCGFYPVGDGYEQIVCKRNKEQQNVIGCDGNFYVFVCETRSGNARFEEAGQRQRRIERWKEENSFKKESFKEYHPQKKQKTVVDSVTVKSNKELDKIYRALLDLLVLDDVHKSYLKQEGWSEDLIEQNHIKSFPEKDFIRFKYNNWYSKNPYRKTVAKRLIEQFGTDALLGVPGAFQDKKGEWTFTGRKGILFPVYDTDGYLYRLRIRMDFMDTNRELVKGNPDWYEEAGKKYFLTVMKGFYTEENGEKIYLETGGKYRNFSSFYLNDEEYKKGFIVNDYKNGCEAENQLGVYMNPSRDNMYICYVTEGEKKGIFANNIMRAPFISVPGVNSWRKLIEGKKGERIIDRLKERGVRMFLIAYDADKTVNEAVLENEQKVIEALKQEGFAIGIAEWDMFYGKGIDDLLLNGKMPDYKLA